MALIRVTEISFEMEMCGVKWQHFYDKIVNKYRYRYEADIW